MRTRNQHLKPRSGMWYYNRRVPEDVAGSFGKTIVKMALKTKDVEQARLIRDKISRELERQWSRQRWAVTSRVPNSLPVTNEDPAMAEYWQDRLDDLVNKHGSGVTGEDYDQAIGIISEMPEGKLISRRLQQAQGIVSISEAGEKFLDGTSLSKSTIMVYRGVYKFASESLPTPTLVTKEQARTFIQAQARRLSASTVSNRRTALRALWSHLGLEESIWSGFRVDAAVKKLHRDIWTDAEVQLLASEASTPMLNQAILIGAYTGAREDEIRSLEYDSSFDTIIFTRSKTEAGLRTIPCPDSIRSIVKDWVKVAIGDRPRISNRFTELKTRLGLPATKVFHSFRHTVATKLLERGIQEALVARIVGHKHDKLTFGLYANKAGVEVLRAPINSVKYRLLDIDTGAHSLVKDSI